MGGMQTIFYMSVSPDRGMILEVYTVPRGICGRPQMDESGLYSPYLGTTETSLIQVCENKWGPGRAAGCTHCVPLIVDVLRAEGDVRVAGLWPQSVCLADLLDLSLNAQDGTSLSISLRQRCLELFMCCEQALGKNQPVHPFITGNRGGRTGS